jgi:outer membrane cobalamin receptor
MLLIHKHEKLLKLFQNQPMGIMLQPFANTREEWSMLFTTRIFRRNVTAYLLFICTWFTFAQDGRRYNDLGMEGLSLERLFSIEITIASKTEEKIVEAPSSVTVFTREEIESMGVTRLRDLLNFVPGFQTSAWLVDGQTLVVQPRGRNRGSISPDVLFLIDGQRLNDSHSGGASLFSRLMTTGNIERVEVIRGPGSALYGSNAYLGVVNVITDTKRNEFRARAGENGFLEGQIHFSRDFGAWQLSLFGSSFTDDGQDYSIEPIPDLLPNGAETTDPRKGSDFYMTVTYDRFTFRARYQERHLEDFFNFGRLATDIDFNTTWESSANLSVNIVEKENFRLNGKVEAMRHRWRSLTQIFPAGGPFPVPFQAGPVYWNLDHGVSLDLDWDINDRHHIIAGAFFRNTENQNLGALTTYANINDLLDGEIFDEPMLVRSAIPNGERDRQISGAYLQDKINVSEAFTIFLGARFDSYSDFGDTFNPRLGLIYAATTNSYFKLLYGSAFRAPAFAELYLDSPDVSSNENLDPEEVETFELVYIQDIQDRGRLAFTLFRNDIDRAIVGVPPEAQGERLRNENRGQAEIAGVEAEATFSLSQNWLLKSTYTRIFSSRSTIEDQPEMSASGNTFRSYGSLILNYEGDAWGFNLNGIFRGEVEDFAGQDAYGLVNTKFDYDLGSQWKLEFLSHNLFDEEYHTYDETFLLLNSAVPNRGREIWFSVKYTY